MNLKDFDTIFSSLSSKTKIQILCDECQKCVETQKWRARENIKKNECYLCRSCAAIKWHKESPMTEETKQLISEKLKGKVVSEESRRKMSEAKKAFMASEEGMELRRHLSQLAVEQHKNNPPIASRRHDYYVSKKGGTVYYDSGYELKAMVMLDADENVISFENHINYKKENGHYRVLDLIVTYSDGHQEVIEVKPFRRIKEFQEQIWDHMIYAHENGYDFGIWTEKELEFKNEYEAAKWADEFIGLLQGIDYTEIRKDNNKKKARKHYDKVISQNIIEVFCEFCQEVHSILRISYDKNVAKNGRYVCHSENAHKPKPKKKKENPYAAEGKKQCTKCKNILPLDEFNKDKSRSDGLSSKCAKCNREDCTNRYNASKSS